MRQQGTVREWNGSYGFIDWWMATDRGARQRHTFVHQSDLVMEGYRRLQSGDIVEFEVEADDTGRKHVVRVRVIESAEPAA